MSTQNLQAFREQLNNDAQLEAAVRNCLTGPQGALDINALTALGKTKGYDFSVEDVRAAMAASNEELSDFELEVVSAGTGGGGISGKN